MIDAMFGGSVSGYSQGLFAANRSGVPTERPPSELPYDPLLYWGIPSGYPWGVCLCVSIGMKVRLLTFVCGTNSVH